MIICTRIKEDFIRKTRGPWRNERGQLTIFLGITLMVVITMLAFVINVGLFVKAKINLQNAVDSAAWSGAAVQARQLTRIANLNWELRNTYKEYMFKYYVLGQLALKDQILNPPVGRNMSFRLRPFFDSTIGSAASSLGAESIDPYNIPSTCIHFGSENNICSIFDVPGIPRFNTVGLPSITPMQESFLNTITATKAKNCSTRSDINFGVAMVWAYGTGSNLFQNVPQIAAQRIGAWPQALELSLRIRNLEFMVNRPPVSQPICFDASAGSCKTVESLNAEQLNLESFPINERPVKAFHSAFRNLGGGAFKAGEDQNRFSATFKLTELPPTPLVVNEKSLSGYLIPTSASMDGSSALEKHYLDLKLWPINMTTFYTTFVNARSDDSIIAGVNAEATCRGSKTSLPLPAYITSFTKNPAVVTYYAVKGEADFVGMFYPFTNDTGIKLSTYAAAKPFGGRIGPKFFGVNSGSENSIVPRANGKSSPYVSTVIVPPTPVFKAGKIIPYTPAYYATTSDAIGGIPGAGLDIKYVIPNLLYSEANISTQNVSGAANLQQLEDALNSRTKYDNPQDSLGLHSTEQFISFKNNMENPSSTIYTNRDIEISIANARGPTLYEAANYLIPALDLPGTDPDGAQVNYRSNFNAIPDIVDTATGIQTYKLYAPLIGVGTLYETPAEIQTIVDSFMRDNESSIDTYIEALFDVATSMRVAATLNRGGANSYNAAANTIHPGVANKDENLSFVDPTDCNTLAVAQKFTHFFKESSESCGIKPLQLLVQEYISSRVANSDFETFYKSSYVNQIGNDALMTAYSPGDLFSVSATGENLSTLQGNSDGKKIGRNFYSTKFVALGALTLSGYRGKGYIQADSKSILNENDNLSAPEADVSPGTVPAVNNLDTSLLSEFATSGGFEY